MFIQRPSCARAKHADLISTRLIVHCVTTSPPELYLVRSHRWWETAAEPGPALLRRTGSREPTSTVSPRTEPCHRDTKTLRTLFLWMSSDPLHCFFCSVTISAPGWASLPGPPPRWAGARCPSAGGTRRGRRRRRWCAGRPRWTPGRTGPHSCCMWSAGGPPARPPSCAEDPWWLSLCLRMTRWIWGVWSGLPLCESPTGLYSRLVNVFAFRTAQTSSLTFTPLEASPLESIITEISVRLSDGSHF